MIKTEKSHYETILKSFSYEGLPLCFLILIDENRGGIPLEINIKKVLSHLYLSIPSLEKLQIPVIYRASNKIYAGVEIINHSAYHIYLNEKYQYRAILAMIKYLKDKEKIN